MNLIEKLTKISEEASGGKLKISYAYDVLLPEVCYKTLHYILLCMLHTNFNNAVTDPKSHKYM